MRSIRTPELREWLVTLLAADYRLAGVDVATHWQGDRTMLAETVFCGDVEPSAGTSVRELGGPTRLEHSIALGLVIQCRQPGGSPASAEVRVIEMYDAVHDTLRVNNTPPAGLAYWAVLGDWSLRAGWSDHGATAEIVTSVLFHIDT
jgi:hypothetical protein